MSAAERLRQAEEQCATARQAVEMARQRFLAEPSMKNEEQVEESERHVRRAERFRDARALAAEKESEARRVEERAQAKAERADLLTQRVEVRRGVRERMAEIAAIYAHLNDVVSALEGVIGEDVALCREFNGLGSVAGDDARATPFTLEGVRLAMSAELGESWDDKPPGSDVDLSDTLKALARLEEPGSPREFYVRLETVVAEVDHAFGNVPLNRWLATLRPPTWQDHSSAAARAKQAALLLAQLKETES